jgi:hypothetical protein
MLKPENRNWLIFPEFFDFLGYFNEYIMKVAIQMYTSTIETINKLM